MPAASSVACPFATSSRQRSSRCCDSSSTISASRDGAMESTDRRARMSALQSGFDSPCPSPTLVEGSGMFPSGCHEAHGLDEVVPRLALLQQHFAARGRQAIEATATLPWFLDPCTFDPAALLEAIEQ